MSSNVALYATCLGDQLWPEVVHAIVAPSGSCVAMVHRHEQLFAADAGLTMAQTGIAETGAVVLISADEQGRLASLLPERLDLVLPRSRLCGTLADALAAR